MQLVGATARRACSASMHNHSGLGWEPTNASVATLMRGSLSLVPAGVRLLLNRAARGSAVQELRQEVGNQCM